MSSTTGRRKGAQRDASGEPSPDAPASTPESERDDSGPVSGLKRWREGIRRRPSVDRAYRLAVALVGFAIVGVGLALLLLPGPGWLIIFVGLGLLATEYEWSRRLLRFTREQVGRWTNWLGGQSIVVRGLVGLGCLLLLAALLVAVLWLFGTPSWVPDWLPLGRDLPTRA